MACNLEAYNRIFDQLVALKKENEHLKKINLSQKKQIEIQSSIWKFPTNEIQDSTESIVQDMKHLSINRNL